MEQSLTLRQLKVVEVRCPIINGSVHNVLKVLRSCSARLDQVIVLEI